MNNILYFTIILLLQLKLGKVNCHFYVGAVVEYSSIFNKTKSPEENIQNNIKEYEKFIRDAKNQYADIIVFPEYGLTSTYIYNKRNEAILYSSDIPHPSEQINPCKENKINKIFPVWSQILTQISCEAMKNQIYVVINLPERVKFNEDWILYNTDVVFDRNGTLMSRYRKYNLYKEPAFNTTRTPEIESFTTDFGVTFGTITCFDILYADPTLSLIRNEGVTDLIFPTAWMSKMPFLTAVQTQAGFVKAYGINLLASNYNYPQNYGSGSGIYSSVSGILNYTISDDKKSQLLVAKIPKIKSISHLKRKSGYDVNKIELYLETLTERWDGFTTEVLNETVNNYKICNEKLCCKFTVQIDKGKSDYIYRLVVTDSYRSSGSNRHHVQICGIVACTGQNVETCGQRYKRTYIPKQFNKVVITGNFNTNDNFVNFPSIVNYDLSTLPLNLYSYKVGNYLSDTIELKTNKTVDKILGISIYGRSRAYA